MHCEKTIISPRIAVLDGLRALAILLVFNVHFLNRYMSANYFVPVESILFRVFAALNATVFTVDLFFIISGYLIFDILKNRPVHWMTFFDRRFSRLFVAHLAVLCYIIFIRGLGVLTPGAFSLNLLFIAPLFPNVEIYNDVTWTLAWEWIYYLLIFFVMLFFRKKNEWIIFLILCALSGVLAAITYFNLLKINFPEFGRFISFYFGIVLAIALKNQNGVVKSYFKKLLPWALLMLPLLSVIWTYKAEVIKALPLNGFYYIVGSCSLLVIIFDSIVNNGRLNKVFSNVIVVWLGRISYSFYLIHQFVIMEVLNRMTPATDVSGVLLRYVFVLIITTAISIVCYFLFEYYFIRKPAPLVIETK